MPDVREFGIPFVGAMVRAVVEDRKTQTRRIITTEPGPYPNARVGDTFWVREAHRMDVIIHGHATVQYRENIPGVPSMDTTPYPYIRGKPYLYPKPVDPLRWRPPMHMFRWASRIDLRITGIRDEPLQAISDADVIAEGLNEALADHLVSKGDGLEVLPEHWINGDENGFSFCFTCASNISQEMSEKNPEGEHFVDGGWPTEGDLPAFCEECDALLHNSYLETACDSEIEHFLSHGLNAPIDYFSMQRVLAAGYWNERSRRVLFRELWDSINADRGYDWETNPMVRVFEFEPVRKSSNPGPSTSPQYAACNGRPQ